MLHEHLSNARTPSIQVEPPCSSDDQQEVLLSFLYGLLELSVQDILFHDTVCARVVDQLIYDNDEMLHCVVEGKHRKNTRAPKEPENDNPHRDPEYQGRRSRSGGTARESPVRHEITTEKHGHALPHALRRIIQLVCLRSHLRQEMENSNGAFPSLSPMGEHQSLFLYPERTKVVDEEELLATAEPSLPVSSLVDELCPALYAVAVQLSLDPGIPSVLGQWSFHALTNLFPHTVSAKGSTCTNTANPCSSNRGSTSLEMGATDPKTIGDIHHIPERALHILGRIAIGFIICAWKRKGKERGQASGMGSVTDPMIEGSGFFNVEGIRQRIFSLIIHALFSSSHRWISPIYSASNELPKKDGERTAQESQAISETVPDVQRMSCDTQHWNTDAPEGSPSGRFLATPSSLPIEHFVSSFPSSQPFVSTAGNEEPALLLSEHRSSPVSPTHASAFPMESSSQKENHPEESQSRTAEGVGNEGQGSLEENDAAPFTYTLCDPRLHSDERSLLFDNCMLLSCSQELLGAYHSELDGFSSFTHHMARKRRRSTPFPPSLMEHENNEKNT